MKALPVVSFCLLLFSCSQKNSLESSLRDLGKTSIPTPPSFDLSTVDLAIKSRWAFETWRDTSYRVPDPSDYEKAWDKVKKETERSFFTSRARQILEQIEKRNREKYQSQRYQDWRLQNVIERVSPETETRAVAFTKEGYGITSFGRFRYVMAKEGGLWHIEQISSECSFCKGTGKREDLEQELNDIRVGLFRTHPEKACEYCGGTGWINSSPGKLD